MDPTTTPPSAASGTAWLRKRVGPVAAVLVGVVVAWVAVWYLVVDKSVPAYAATRGDLSQSVVASGQVITPQRASIAAEITGRVARVPVSEGETVRRDRILIELDQKDELAALAQSRAALAQAEAKLRQIDRFALPAAEQNLLQARANLTQAEVAYKRTGDLVASNFVSHAQLDDARRNLDVARSQVRAAELQVASESPNGADRVLAELARREAQTAVGVAEAKLDATVIRAPSDGVLIGRSVEPGDVAQAGKELLVLAPAGEVQVVVNVDEKNLGKLAAGQHAIGSADAYPDQTFAAQLFYINPGVDPVRGSVQVKLRVPDPPAYLRQDMSVSVDIEVAHRRDALIVPADAIHDAGTPHPWVMTVRNGRTARQPVALGMRGDRAVEISAGLAAGDVVVPATNAVVRAGQRIRPLVIAAAG